jgi:transitional endoplasmic reticulum ATPase
MFCNSCGAQNPGDARFCSACGKAIAAAAHSPQVSQAQQTARSPQAAPADESKALWDRLILPAEIKQILQNACQILRETAQSEGRGLTPPNILLFGPPGTGRTEIVRTLAMAAGVSFIAVTAMDLKTQYIGQGGKRVRDVFDKARAMAPAILFFDEIETVAAKRDSDLCDDLTGDIVSEFLLQISGIQPASRPVMIVAATIRPEEIDPAILSRFRRIEIPLPDEAARGMLLEQLIRGCGCALDPALDVNEVAAMLAKKTPQMSGRDLKLRVSRAVQQAVISALPGGSPLTRESLLAAFVTPAPKAT